MIFLEKSLEKYEDEAIYLEAQSSDTYFILDELYPKIESVLSTPQGDRLFKIAVGKYVDRNSSKLHTPGPQYMIPFGDTDKNNFYNVFHIQQSDVTKVVDKVVKALRGESTSNFVLLRNNPMFWVFYCCVRYYTLVKDQKGLNTALAIYALANYPSIFHKYFKYEVSSPATMQYTLDNLTNKYIIKQQGHIFGTLFFSINNSYTFLKDDFKNPSDKAIVRFIQRIHNDQNSLIKKICDQYQQNFAKGLRVSTVKDSFDENPIDDNNFNNTTQVETVAQKVVFPIITNGVDLARATASAKIAEINVSDCRYYLNRIITDKNTEVIRKLIESILFLYLYDEKKTKEDINSSYFLVWSSQLFRKTNSNDKNIGYIKDTLEKFAQESGITTKFKRVASQVNYKKSIFFYFILCIQAYN